MQVDAATRGQPVLDQRRLVGDVIVPDLRVQVSGHFPFNGSKELVELHGPVAPLVLNDHLADPGVQGHA